MLCASVCATAQKEDNVWIFGENRIDFSTTPPTVTPTACSYVTEENVTSVADKDGNLVYWLNGTSLYNSNDEVVYSLPVGENVFYFYSLSIVPFPDRENVYLFMYPDAVRGRMVASIADGSKDLLHPVITEKYAEFPYYLSANSVDGVPLFFQKYGSRNFWMLYSWFNKIKVYQLTADGFSYTGNEYQLPMYDGRLYDIDGCEMTPDRSKILATTSGYGGVSYFIDLDTKTGEIKLINPIKIKSMEAFAFSSGNKYLYCSNNGGLYRIPVEALGRISTNDEFVANREFVGELGCEIGDIKFLASGGMYFHNENTGEHIGIVRDCDSEHPVIDNKWLRLAKNTSGHKYSWFLALPKTYCYPYGFVADEMCGGEVHFSFNDADCESISWDFGDGSEGVVLGHSVEHVYTSNGRYTVRLTANYSDDRPQQTVEWTIEVKNIMKKLTIVKE